VEREQYDPNQAWTREAQPQNEKVVERVEEVIPTERELELERKCLELGAENASLRRELEREKDRYTDLMSVFRATRPSQGNPARLPTNTQPTTIVDGPSILNAMPSSRPNEQRDFSTMNPITSTQPSGELSDDPSRSAFLTRLQRLGEGTF